MSATTPSDEADEPWLQPVEIEDLLLPELDEFAILVRAFAVLLAIFFLWQFARAIDQGSWPPAAHAGAPIEQEQPDSP